MEYIKICAVLLCLFHFIKPSSVIKGPPRAERAEQQQVVRLGDDVRIRCPIEGYPTPMVAWSKGDENIDYTWDRFRGTKKNLKIKGVQIHDSGVYYCKGVNGFGKAEIKIKLIVIDPSDFPQLDDTELSKLSAPEFRTQGADNQIQNIYRQIGQSVSLNCESVGRPIPRVSWYKDRELYRDSGHILTFGSLQASDSGLYTCNAQNIIGSISTEFNLQVNTYPCKKGDTAKFECRVHNSLEYPAVKWLRRVDNTPQWMNNGGGVLGGGAGTLTGAGILMDNLISVDGTDQYQLIEETQLLDLGGGEYVSKLEIPAVSAASAGLYLCFLATQQNLNSLGSLSYAAQSSSSALGGVGYGVGMNKFDVIPAYLTVIQKSSVEPNISSADDTVPLTILLAAVAAIFALSAILLFLCCYQRRQKQLEAGSTGSGEQQLPCPSREALIDQHHNINRQEQQLIYHQQHAYHPYSDYHQSTGSGGGGMNIVVNNMDDLLNHNTQQLLQQHHYPYQPMTTTTTTTTATAKHSSSSPAVSRKSTKSSSTGKSTKSGKYLGAGGEENTYEVPHVFPAHTKSRDPKQNGGGYFLAPNGYYGARR